MNTAASSVGLSPILASQSIGSDDLPQESLPDADFTAALAAAIAPAVVEEIADIAETDVPDGMQSAAALAWMASMLNSEAPRRDVPSSGIELLTDIAPGTVVQAQVPAADVVATSAEVAAQLVTADVGDVAESAQAALVPTMIKPADGRGTGESQTNQVADAADSGFMMGLVEDDALKAQVTSGATRLLNAFVDQSAANDTIATRMDTSAPTPTLYTNSREAYLTAATPEVVTHETMREPIGSPRWATELGTRLILMAVRGRQEGSLSLTPEHLGPLEIRINVSQDTTNVWFGAQHADTRAALTDAMPRLRELLAASGLALGHAGVSHQMPRHEARQAEASALAVGRSDESNDVTATTPAVQRIRSVLLDAWA
jgi:flagellar hook-length control protein FliK